MNAEQTKRVSGTLIVAGIGATAPFEAVLADLDGVPERLIVIEPAETPGGTHAQRLAGMNGVDLVDGLPAAAAGPAELVRYNLPGLRGLHAPTEALRTLFPGLTERARIPTRTILPADAIGDPGALPAPLRLRIDLPGSEADILHALEAAGMLEAVETVSLRCGAEAPFEGGQDRAQLQSWLRERHFRVDHVDEDDPDWPELRLSADPAARRIDALEAELARARADAAASEEMLHAELADTADKLKAEETRRAETETALQETRAALDTAHKQAETQKAALDAAEAARATLESERDNAAARVETLGADLEKARAEAEELHRELARNAEQIQAREGELSEAADRLKAEETRRAETETALQETRAALDTARKQAETQKTALDAAEAARATLESERDNAAARARDAEDAAERAHTERDKAFSDLGLAMRMQGLMQSDLDDLRERYRKSEETRGRQEELLRKLTPRLQEAAQQLRRMQLTADAEIAAELPAPAKTAPKPAKSKPRAKTTPRKRTSRKKTTDGT